MQRRRSVRSRYVSSRPCASIECCERKPVLPFGFADSSHGTLINIMRKLNIIRLRHICIYSENEILPVFFLVIPIYTTRYLFLNCRMSMCICIEVTNNVLRHLVLTESLIRSYRFGRYHTSFLKLFPDESFICGSSSLSFYKRCKKVGKNNASVRRLNASLTAL